MHPMPPGCGGGGDAVERIKRCGVKWRGGECRETILRITACSPNKDYFGLSSRYGWACSRFTIHLFFLFPGKGDYYRYLNEIQNRNSRERRDDLRKKTEEAYRTIRPSRPPTSCMHNPHIQYDWAWCSTSLCSTTRSLIPQKRPLNWRGKPLTRPWLTGV